MGRYVVIVEKPNQFIAHAQACAASATWSFRRPQKLGHGVVEFELEAQPTWYAERVVDHLVVGSEPPPSASYPLYWEKSPRWRGTVLDRPGRETIVNCSTTEPPAWLAPLVLGTYASALLAITLSIVAMAT